MGFPIRPVNRALVLNLALFSYPAQCHSLLFFSKTRRMPNVYIGMNANKA